MAVLFGGRNKETSTATIRAGPVGDPEAANHRINDAFTHESDDEVKDGEVRCIRGVAVDWL